MLLRIISSCTIALIVFLRNALVRAYALARACAQRSRGTRAAPYQRVTTRGKQASQHHQRHRQRIGKAAQRGAAYGMAKNQEARENEQTISVIA